MIFSIRNIGFLFLCLGLIISHAVYPFDAQRADSIKRAISAEHDIREKVGLFLALGKVYQDKDLDTAKVIGLQAYSLAKLSNDEEYLGLLHSFFGDLALFQDSTELAKAEYQKAIPFLISAEAHNELVRTYHKLGNRYIETDNLPDALDSFLKAIRLAEEIGDTERLPNLNNNLGVVYLKLNQPQKALELYSEALDLFIALADTVNWAGTTTNIGSIYMQLGDYDIARYYYQNGYEIFKSINLQAGEAHALFKLGMLDFIQKKYDSALNNLHNSLKIQNALAVRPGISKNMFVAETKTNIGIVYYSLGNFDEALKYLNVGFEIAFQNKQLSLIASTSEYLGKIYKARKIYDKALEYHEIFKQYSDSTFNEDNIRRLAQLEMQHQFEVSMREAELQRKIDEQKRKRNNLIYLVITVGMFFVLIIVALLLKLERNKKKEMEFERTVLLEKLEHANKELTTYVMYLLKKNEFILTIIEKLKKTKMDVKPENKKVIAELISELKSNSDTVSWEEFELRFQEVHNDFYIGLGKEFPDLSNNEIRLCAFFKLNMTTKEIAAITYQSLNSIKVARYRLRKKLNLESSANLHTFLSKY